MYNKINKRQFSTSRVLRIDSPEGDNPSPTDTLDELYVKRLDLERHLVNVEATKTKIEQAISSGSRVEKQELVK
jgi:hypothetical protein